MIRKTFYFGGCAIAVAVATALVLGSDGRARDANAQELTPRPKKAVDVNAPNAVDPVNPERQLRAPNRTREREACRASELLGMNVRGSAGDDSIGEIKDLMITPEGKVAYAAVSFGGFLGIGDKMFAVPCEAIHFVKDGDSDRYARINVTEETLKNSQGFDKDDWPEKADKSFLTLGGPRQAERPRAAGTTN